MQYCACCCRGCKKHETDSEVRDQFLKQDGTYGAETFGVPQQNKASSGCNCTRIMQILIILFMLATIGVSGWGIYASLKSTDSQISNFWTFVDTIEQKAANTTGRLQELDSRLGTLQTSTAAIAQDSAEIGAALAAMTGGDAKAITAALNALSGASSDIADTRASIQEGVNTVNDNIESTIEGIKDDYKGPSTVFQNKGRLITIAVLFGLTILAALGAALLALRVKHPVWASAFVAVLWFCTALLMLLGVGLLSGLVIVSKDACLYLENYAVDYAATKVVDSQQREWTLNALGYYFNQTEVGQEAPGAALKAVTGVDIAPITAVIQSDEVTQLTSLLGGLTPDQLQSSGISPTAVAAMQNVSGTIQPLTQTRKCFNQSIFNVFLPMKQLLLSSIFHYYFCAVTDLDLLTSRASVLPLYTQGKHLICCDVAAASNDLFLAWTIVGCLGFVLAALCSWRIVRHTFNRNKSKVAI